MPLTYGCKPALAALRPTLLALPLLLGGCASLKPTPWVKPYERDNLADPIMAFDRNGVDADFMKHVFGNREGAVGAEGSGGGGCGCN